MSDAQADEYDTGEKAAGEPEMPPADYCRWCHYEFDPPVNEPVLDDAGRRFEHAIDTEPGTRIWCPSCRRAQQTEKHTAENRALTEFGQ